MSQKKNPNTEVLKYLVAEEQDGNDDMPLLAINSNPNIGIVQCLISGGADVNAQNENGLTSSHWIAADSHRFDEQEREARLRCLVENVSNTSMQEETGVTPSFNATIADFAKIIKASRDELMSLNIIAKQINLKIASIPGISLNEKSDVRCIHFSPDTTLDNIKSLLQILRENRIEFAVYDALYPSPSDPGAYLSYSQIKSTPPNYWSMTLGNHGWTGGIYAVEEEIVACQLENLLKKGFFEELQLDSVGFFLHYDLETSDHNKEMNDLLCKIHE